MHPNASCISGVFRNSVIGEGAKTGSVPKRAGRATVVFEGEAQKLKINVLIMDARANFLMYAYFVGVYCIILPR